MRVNLLTQNVAPTYPLTSSIPLSLTIRPACGLPGEYAYPTDSTSLMRMLRRKTDLPSTVLKRFEGALQTGTPAKLLGVELSEGVLTEIGYFVD
ncbi:hypothetical protein [Granulicella tundricola]|uniref:Uncharacterized protein n=1 Tax=Granulicella tundricola (strain ATCC BAA-1859 / DSM 23138 / MP5ACTX9) TaxID=1198114 RepID=E8X2U6_GRATM|nr:hypothetical protein [Granulicella tundricola]ADW70393.1 hypothetical protein AciX9_3386 [Granulicella tundricola MP5ACTX9]